MNFFRYRKSELYCEGVKLRTLCGRHGTPLYVYSLRTLLRHLEHVKKAWKSHPVVIAYAMKANSNLAILRIFKNHGTWVDTVSLGEIFRALGAGFPPGRIIFGGVGKSEDELRYAIEKGVFLIVADSMEEISLVNEIAVGLKKKVRLAVRVNPGVDPLTHAHIATGMKESKFGIPSGEVQGCFRFASTLPGIDVAGIHQHIGSQIVDLKPFLESLRWLGDSVRKIRGLGIDLRWMDIGGGIGIRYKDEQPFSLEDFSKEIIPFVRESGCRLIVEPGRVIVGNAGVLLARVLYIKDSGRRRFVIVDAAMNDLLRPALYGAYHEILPVKKSGPGFIADVVGPVCESGDFLARDRAVPQTKRGDVLAVMSAGAYGFAMSSNYNSRPRAAEVLVSGGRSFVIREREKNEDLVKGERIPGLLMRGVKAPPQPSRQPGVPTDARYRTK